MNTRRIKIEDDIIRHRHRYMPSFKCGTEPALNEANIDQIKVHIKRGYQISFSNYEQFNAFKHALSGTELFRQGIGNQSGIFTIKRGGTLGERWLLGGTVKFQKIGGNANFIAVLNLNFNPSRFINHSIHSHGDPAGISDVENFIRSLRSARPTTVMEKSVVIEPVRGLDNGDNLIPKKYYRGMRPAVEITEIYIRQATALIREAIEGCLPDPSGQLIELLEDWSVSHCEIYWEYSVSNAIAFVNGLRGYLEPHFHDTEWVDYHLSRESDPEYSGAEVTSQINQNSPCLRLNPGSKNVEYKIYAKEWDRVRFEVAYKANLRGQRRMKVSDLAAQILGIGTLITPVIADAQKRMKKLFAALPDMDYSERCDFQNFTEFLAQLAQAGNESRGTLEDIISLLSSNHKIVVADAHPQSGFYEHLAGEQILRLATAGRKSKGYKTYILNTRYSNVIRAIVTEFSRS